MKYLFSLYLFGLLFGCGSNPKEVPPKEIIKETPFPEEIIEQPTVEEVITPIGAAEANYIQGEIPFYGYVLSVFIKNGTSIIGF